MLKPSSTIISSLFLVMALAAAAIAAGPAERLELDFSRDPAAQGLVLEGPDVASRIDWDRHDPAAYPGDARGSLRVVYDAASPTVRALVPLQETLSGDRPFVLEADLVLETLDASPTDFHAISFGLSNRATTGDNRTGTAPFFGDTNVFDHVEVSYFPNVTSFGGPTLTPTVFGGDIGAGTAFANFAALFGPAADLGDNGPDQIDELPVGSPVRLRLSFDPCAAAMFLEVEDLSMGEPVPLDAGLVPLDLSFLLATEPFAVDALTVSAFEDRADFDPSTPALFAVVRYHRLALETTEFRARAVPRVWKAGRGGDLMLRVTGAAAPVSVEVGGAVLPAEPVDGHGHVLKVEGEAFEEAALDVLGSGDLLSLTIRSSCFAVEDTLRVIR